MNFINDDELSQYNIQKNIDLILKDKNNNNNKNKFKKSLKYFYNICIKTGYIRIDLLNNNLKLPKYYDNNYNINFDILINCARPEILINSNNSNNSSKCNICIENIYLKKELRVYEFSLLNGKQFFLQFSPYPYYNYHSVIIDKQHRPQKISEDTFNELLELSEQMPNYTVMSNSDKQYSGVSNPFHHHYQGGYHDFAIYNALSKYELLLDDGKITLQILNYPAGCIKLSSNSINKSNLIKCCIKLFHGWLNFENNNDLFQLNNLYQTFSLSCRFNIDSNQFQIILVPRNGEPNKFITRDYLQCIKKEFVGIGEISGNATLPGRLKDELFNHLFNFLQNNLSNIQNNKNVNNNDQYNSILKINEENILNNLSDDLKKYKNWLKQYFFNNLKTNYNNNLKEILEISLYNSYIDIISDNSPIKNNDIILNWINQSKLI